MTVDPITIGAETAAGVYRVFRGGSWFNIALNARAADRNDYTPDDRNNLIGFRLAATCKAPAPVVQ